MEKSLINSLEQKLMDIILYQLLHVRIGLVSMLLRSETWDISCKQYTLCNNRTQYWICTFSTRTIMTN